jgi:hypothetical protein
MAEALNLPSRDGGSITIQRSYAPTCASCDAPIDADTGISLIVEVGAHRHPQRPTLTIPGICGGCVSEAFALFFGRRHVQRGGVVEDLQLPPDQEPPSAA